MLSLSRVKEHATKQLHARAEFLSTVSVRIIGRQVQLSNSTEAQTILTT